jgi:MYXO-CTERM domain-containing protein
VASAALDCNDGDDCTTDSCHDDFGCQYEPIAMCGESDAGATRDAGWLTDGGGSADGGIAPDGSPVALPRATCGCSVPGKSERGLPFVGLLVLALVRRRRSS